MSSPGGEVSREKKKLHYLGYYYFNVLLFNSPVRIYPFQALSVFKTFSPVKIYFEMINKH